MMEKGKILASLYKMYDEINIIGCSTIVKMLNAMKINSLVNYLVYHEKEYDEQDREMMAIIIKVLQYVYNNSDTLPPITDELYDQLYAVMISDGSADIVGADVGSDRTIMYHQYPDLRGTLDKVHFYTNDEKGKNEKRKSIYDWFTSIENKIGRRLTALESEISIFPKFDGVSVIFECDRHGNVERALTRGDVNKNEACEIPIFRGFTFMPYTDWGNVPFAVKTEVIMKHDNFKKFCKKYGQFKSPRSAVSSIINGQTVNIDHLKYISIIPLRMQNFTTGEIIVHPDAYSSYPHERANISEISYADLYVPFNRLKKYMEEVLNVPCDGVVIYLEDYKLRKILGRENHINKYEVAYKFPPIGVKSKLIDVEFSIGLMGYVNPVAKFEPIVLNGNTVQHASLGSIDRFESLNLHYNDEVIIKYEIIPYLTKDDSCAVGNELIKAITHCIFCGEELETSPMLRCVNRHCPCRQIGAIVNYLNELSIMNISEAIVTTFFNLGILRSIEDLYKLKDFKDIIINTPGFGKKQYEKIIKGIDARRTIKDYELLGALGIKDARSKKFKGVSFIYYIDELIEICKNMDVKSLKKIHGIGGVLAENIISGILGKLDLINFLKSELTIINTKGVDSGTVILFSKVKNNKDFENYLKEQGYEISDGYNKNVSLLIVPSLNETSSKIEKARKDGKEIITIDEAYERFNYGG